MEKPQKLREYLIQCVPALQKNPDQLQIFINAGSLQTRLQANLNFQYSYSLEVIITDMGIHPDNVLVPLLAWLKVHQTDLAEDAIQFEADIIKHDLIDFSLTVPLTEGVLVNTNEDGNYLTDHIDEPVPEYNLPDPALFKALLADGALMTRGYSE